LCCGCERNIAWYDLIPVISWVVLRGKCRYCDRKVSFYYVLVELFIGLVSYHFFKDMQFTFVLLAEYFFLLSFFLNVLTDFTNFTVYDPFLYVMVFIAGLCVLLRGEFLNGLFSGMAVVIFIVIVSYVVGLLVKKQAIGSGDYFVFFALGMIVSLAKILDIILFASLLGIIIALIFKKKKLPFFPLLFFGYMFVLFGGALL
ncbi:MAG: prepilin peptidase, partial [Candidatus Riflemargulisbacteria bacterium]